MRRRAGMLLLAAGLWLGPASPLWAQQPWPELTFERGDGIYLSWLKLVAYWLLFFLWVATADWVNRDCQRFGFGWTKWNPILVFPFLITALVILLIPFFAIGLPMLILAYAIPVGMYVRMRNARVELHQKVLTPDHLRFLAAERLRPLGIKIRAERLRPDQMGPKIEFVLDAAPSPEQNNANLYQAKQSPGYLPTREMLVAAKQRRADAIMFDFTAQAVAQRYEIDGVWHNGEAQEREVGDAILATLKTLGHMNPADRQARQAGSFGIKEGKKVRNVRMVSQGTRTGERAVLQFQHEALLFKRLEELGMRDKLIEQVKRLLATPSGYILFSGPPKGGLTSLTEAALSSADRYVRSWVALEDAARPDFEIENIPPRPYNAAAGESVVSILPKVAREYPDVIVCRHLPDGATVDALCQQAEQNRMIVSTIQARDAVESVLRVLMLKCKAPQFAAALAGAVNVRLIRKLCPDCKEAYPPPPQLLQQLRIPAGRVEALYRPPTAPPENDEVCEKCMGIGYLGRTGLFEVLTVDDAFRQALVQTPRADVLRAQARKSGMRNLQDEGLLMVIKGETSLQELTRVLKGEEKAK